MLYPEQLKQMPKRHVFATGDGEYPEISEVPIRWVAEWSGIDWNIKAAPIRFNTEQVRKIGKIVDVPKLIYQLLPASDEAMKMYIR